MIKNILEKLDNLENLLHIYKINQELEETLEEKDVNKIKSNIRRILNY